jgi:hypothetical protein
MHRFNVRLALFGLAALALGCSEDEPNDTDGTDDASDTEVAPLRPAAGELSFFVTSTGSGADGGNIGGLAGADAKCAALAEEAGAVGFTWRAYLSSSEVDAIDRIGDGPWYNAEADLVAADLTSLRANGISNAAPQHMRDENGDVVPQREHDIFTGSNDAGELYLDENGATHTCNDWTSSGTEPGGPRVGHSDVPTNPMFSASWNNAHDAPACDQASIAMVGGAGRLYCFAL